MIAFGLLSKLIKKCSIHFILRKVMDILLEIRQLVFYASHIFTHDLCLLLGCIKAIFKLAGVDMHKLYSIFDPVQLLTHFHLESYIFSSQYFKSALYFHLHFRRLCFQFRDFSRKRFNFLQACILVEIQIIELFL